MEGTLHRLVAVAIGRHEHDHPGRTTYLKSSLVRLIVAEIYNYIENVTISADSVAESRIERHRRENRRLKKRLDTMVAAHDRLAERLGLKPAREPLDECSSNNAVYCGQTDTSCPC